MTLEVVDDGSVHHTGLYIDMTQLKRGVRLTIGGDIDLAWTTVFAAAFDMGDITEVDLAGVSFMDSHALRILIDARTPDGERPRIVAASPAVVRVLDLTGLRELLAPALDA